MSAQTKRVKTEKKKQKARQMQQLREEAKHKRKLAANQYEIDDFTVADDEEVELMSDSDPLLAATKPKTRKLVCRGEESSSDSNDEPLEPPALPVAKTSAERVLDSASESGKDRTTLSSETESETSSGLEAETLESAYLRKAETTGHTRDLDNLLTDTVIGRMQFGHSNRRGSIAVQMANSAKTYHVKRKKEPVETTCFMCQMRLECRFVFKHKGMVVGMANTKCHNRFDVLRDLNELRADIMVYLARRAWNRDRESVRVICRRDLRKFAGGPEEAGLDTVIDKHEADDARTRISLLRRISNIQKAAVDVNRELFFVKD